MRGAARTLAGIACADPSFRADGPWQGTFDGGGRPARLVADSEGWLLASVPIPGDLLELHRLIASVRQPVKVIPGPRLIAELPCGEQLEVSLRAVREALRRGLDVLGLENGSAARPTDAAVGPPDLEGVFAESRFGWTSSDGTRTTRAGGVTMTAHVADGAATFEVRLVRLRTAVPADSLSALVDFLVAINGRLRFARAVRLVDRLALEAIVPLRVLTPSAIDRAVEALATGAPKIKRECAALLSPAVARHYLEFHNERRDVHANRDA